MLPSIEAARPRLLQLLQTLAFQQRDVVLSSGRRSNFYIDCKEVTLHPEGALLCGVLLFDRVRRLREAGRDVVAIGGLTLGADPMATSVSLVSGLVGPPVAALLVRKEAKGHGTQRYVEGGTRLGQGAEVVVLEDTVTTGASSGVAVERLREAGFQVNHALAIVDRCEGGEQKLATLGIELGSLFVKKDFIDED